MTSHQVNGRFWKAADELVSTSKIVIDRPKGSRHPRFESIIYPLDYGYLDGTVAGDGDGIDVWIGSEPELGVVSILVSIDLLKRDAEIKLLYGCTEPELALSLKTSNTESQSAILIRQ